MVALKIIPYNADATDSSQAEVFYNEVIWMSEVNHPNLWKLIDYNEATEAITKSGQKAIISYIAMEYAKEGELFEWITKTGKFTEDEARYFFHQLIEGLEAMHKLGYYHRDIKPTNLLLDANYNLKIADFGFATTMASWKVRKGTVQYMTPEMLEQRTYLCEQADLYGAAITLFNLVTGLAPQCKRTINEKFWTAHSGENLSPEFKDLFSRMVAYDPTKRLTIDQIKGHKWYNGRYFSPEDIKLRFKKRKNMIHDHCHSSTSSLVEGIWANLHRCKSTQLSKPSAKRTKFYQVSSGDELVNTVIEFARVKGYTYNKSRNLYQVELKKNSTDEDTWVKVNIISKCSRKTRCLQFVKVRGTKPSFNSIFAECHDFCDRRF